MLLATATMTRMSHFHDARYWDAFGPFPMVHCLDCGQACLTAAAHTACASSASHAHKLPLVAGLLLAVGVVGREGVPRLAAVVRARLWRSLQRFAPRLPHIGCLALQVQAHLRAWTKRLTIRPPCPLARKGQWSGNSLMCCAGQWVCQTVRIQIVASSAGPEPVIGFCPIFLHHPPPTFACICPVPLLRTQCSSGEKRQQS